MALSILEGPESYKAAGPLGRSSNDPGPLGELPRITRRQARLQERLGPFGSRIGPGGLLGGIGELLGEGLTADRFEIFWRAAGITRPAVIAQLSWPRLAIRIGIAIEPPLAHALVDRLLGFERHPAEGRLQVTPVEWGILSFVMARALDRLDVTPGPLGPWDLTIDRVGLDPVDLAGLGPIVTWRWRVRIGQTTASVRLWLPESLMALWLLDDSSTSGDPYNVAPLADLSSEWRAEIGSIRLAEGWAKLLPGILLRFDGTPITGTPFSPVGSIELVQDDNSTRSFFEARALPGNQVVSLILESPMKRKPRPRAGVAAATPKPPADTSFSPISSTPLEPSPDLPVTVVVELGRISLPLLRLSELKAGDILELGRHARDPVELTSGGRLIARGELVQIESELGVRVTQVFL